MAAALREGIAVGSRTPENEAVFERFLYRNTGYRFALGLLITVLLDPCLRVHYD